jgi:hypothetical protein
MWFLRNCTHCWAGRCRRPDVWTTGSHSIRKPTSLFCIPAFIMNYNFNYKYPCLFFNLIRLVLVSTKRWIQRLLEDEGLLKQILICIKSLNSCKKKIPKQKWGHFRRTSPGPRQIYRLPGSVLQLYIFPLFELWPFCAVYISAGWEYSIEVGGFHLASLNC